MMLGKITEVNGQTAKVKLPERELNSFIKASTGLSLEVGMQAIVTRIGSEYFITSTFK